MKDRSERVLGDFSPDNIANYKTLSRGFFCRLWHGSLFEQKKKRHKRQESVFYSLGGFASLLFCEFGESAI